MRSGGDALSYQMFPWTPQGQRKEDRRSEERLIKLVATKIFQQLKGSNDTPFSEKTEMERNSGGEGELET